MQFYLFAIPGPQRADACKLNHHKVNNQTILICYTVGCQAEIQAGSHPWIFDTFEVYKNCLRPDFTECSVGHQNVKLSSDDGPENVPAC